MPRHSSSRSMRRRRAVRTPGQAPAQDDLTAKLQQLADLHAQGVLTDEEFSAAKVKLLAG